MMKETIYIIWSRKNLIVFVTMCLNTRDIFRVPPMSGDDSMRVYKEKARFRMVDLKMLFKLFNLA